MKLGHQSIWLVPFTIFTELSDWESTSKNPQLAEFPALKESDADFFCDLWPLIWYKLFLVYFIWSFLQSKKQTIFRHLLRIPMTLDFIQKLDKKIRIFYDLRSEYDGFPLFESEVVTLETPNTVDLLGLVQALKVYSQSKKLFLYTLMRSISQSSLFQFDRL